MSRTCFECYKWLPSPDGSYHLRKGVYYFLPADAQFLQRSKLGGHWFEGHPFQEGNYSTSDLPKPVWRDGSVPIGAGYEHVPYSCNCPSIADKRLSYVRVQMFIPGAFGPFIYPPAPIAISPATGVATFDQPPWPVCHCNVQWQTAPCSATFKTDGTLGDEPALLTYLPSGQPPEYLFEVRSIAGKIRYPPGSGNPPRAAAIVWRFYRDP